MGFRKPNLDMAYHAIRISMVEIGSPYNDGFTSSHCKHELYLLKCWLEDEYKKLPTFSGEQLWEHKRLIEVLKQ
jgi:hypothetical protein